MNQYKLVFDIHMYIKTKQTTSFRFAVVEGADGISAYLDMLDAWYAEHRLYLLMFTASENEDIDAELLETSHLAGMQITIVNIFRLSLSTKMLPKVMFS